MKHIFIQSNTEVKNNPNRPNVVFNTLCGNKERRVVMKTNKLTTLFFTLALIFGLGATAQVTTYPHTSDFEGSLGEWVNSIGR